MKIFALETDTEKLSRSFLSRDESILLTIRFHGFLFLMKLLRAILFTIPFMIADVLIAGFEVPMSWVITATFLIWLFVVFLPLVEAFIDWQFDLLLITTEKIIVVDQSSVFHQEIRQMNLDNVASVNAKTQCWDIFPFGVICFDLKEGVGQRLCLKYIPDAPRAASVISDAVTLFQRRRAAIAHHTKLQ